MSHNDFNHLKWRLSTPAGRRAGQVYNFLPRKEGDTRLLMKKRILVSN